MSVGPTTNVIAPLRRYTLPLLTLVLLLAAGVRILHIAEQSLWIDEGATYFVLRQNDLIGTLAEYDVHPPLYFALLELWTLAAGRTEVALRMFSALCSILSVAAIVPLARILHRGFSWFQHPVVPILAALLLTLSDPEVVLAQDARMYSLRTLLTIVSMIGYLRWIEKPNARRAAFWVIASVALLHTQYQGLYIMALQGLHTLFFLRGRVRLIAIGGLALIGVLFAPWFLGVGIAQLDNDQGIQASLPSNWNTLTEIGYKYFSRQWPLMIGLLLLGIVALLPSGQIRWRRAGTAALLAAWIAITLGVTFVLNQWFQVLAPHRILLMSPAIAILTARGLRNLTAFPRALLVGVIVVYGLATVDDYYPKEPWREVGEQMSRYARHGEMALLEVYRGDNPLTFYLDTMMPPGTPIESLRIWREHTPDQYPSGIIDRLNRHATVWLMHWSPNPSAFDFLVQTGHIRTASMAVDHWGNALNTYRYDQLPAEPLAVFSNGMTLHQAVIVPDSARIDLWWSVEEALPTDYTVSAFLLDATGRLVAQHDAYPFENQRATTTFSPGEVVYDPHPLAFDDLPLGEYTAAVQLYTYYDGQPYPPLQSDTRWFTLGTFVRP